MGDSRLALSGLVGDKISGQYSLGKKMIRMNMNDRIGQKYEVCWE